VSPVWTPPDQEAPRNFWQVYEAHFDEISNDLLTLLEDDPDFGRVLASMSEEERLQQNRESRERLCKAILQGDREPYHAELRTQGAAYAQMGVSFAGWFRLIGMLRPRMTKFLLDAFGETPDRLRSTIGAMDEFIDVAMALVGEEYLRVKQDVIVQQQESIREISTPVLHVRDGVLLLPVVGLIDSNRARQMTGSWTSSRSNQVPAGERS
jgi:rsbT co-antagonist protein RsbR